MSTTYVIYEIVTLSTSAELDKWGDPINNLCLRELSSGYDFIEEALRTIEDNKVFYQYKTLTIIPCLYVI